VHVLQNLTYTHRVAFRQLVATFYTNFPGQFRKLRETKYLRKVWRSVKEEGRRT
jgi:hypothetical protein